MTTTTKNGAKGTQGVNGSQKTTQVATNGKPALGMASSAAPEKTTLVANDKPKGIEEQMKFFDGLAQLVNIKRRFETHKDALESLSISDEELAKFETEKRYGIRITIHDETDDQYVISNPKLVKELQGYLIATLDGKIKEYDQKIMAYGN